MSPHLRATASASTCGTVADGSTLWLRFGQRGLPRRGRVPEAGERTAAMREGVNRLSAMPTSDLELFAAIIEQAPEAMMFADREGIMRIWNARAEVIFGFAASEAIGRSIDLIIPEDLRAAHWRGYHQAITTGQTKSGGRAMATRALHKHGRKLYVELAFGIVRGSPPGVLGALATARDITQSYLASRAKQSRSTDG